MKICFVTGNRGKYIGAKAELEEFDIQLEQVALETPEPRSYDLREIAKDKALFAYERVGEPLIVLDAGFYLNRWKDFPGPFTNHALHGLGIEGIMKLLEGEERGCEFRNALAYIDREHAGPVYFENKIPGTVPGTPRGGPHERQWSELHTIFIPSGFEKTLAEMSDNEYAEYRRWRASKRPIFRQFGEWLTPEHNLY